jgi:hypothetical protein
MKKRIAWSWKHYYTIEYKRHWWSPWFTLKYYPVVTESTQFDPGRMTYPKLFSFDEALRVAESLTDASLDAMLAEEKAHFTQRYAAFKVRQAAWRSKGIYF